MSSGYFVRCDSREQTGWTFEPHDKCLGSEYGKVDTGDYTIKGLEDYICIERKACASELSMNLGVDKVRFFKELERMRPIKHKYIICEFSLDDLLRFPEGAGIPAYKLKNVKMTGKIILKLLLEAQLEYDLKVMFCDSPSGAFTMTASIFKRIYEKYG
jgi:hypothetical protein